MFKKIGFTLLFLVEMLVVTAIGSVIGNLIVAGLYLVVPSSDVWTTGSMYLTTVGIWIAVPLYLYVFKKNRPLLDMVGNKAKVNNLKNALLGIFFGFGLNFACALMAMVKKDISLSFNSFNLLYFVFLFIVVYIQSSSEELLCRALFYQRLKTLYDNLIVAVGANAMLFAALHIPNPGVTPLAIINIAIQGVLLSLLVYYFDSLWMAFGMHAAWNFTQNILLGLPNSGLCMPYSVFKLDAAKARDSFAYSVSFGVESTVTACFLFVACSVLLVVCYSKNAAKAEVTNEAESNS
ncbi:MAG: CPBP family intramembrane metalloprotease [Pseudobutyrivibrio sp.]|nr:CPBP family intramembrane metalloprotease [Pseudobutyrivibrio sp.]